MSLADRRGHRCRCAELLTCRRRTRPDRRSRAPDRQNPVTLERRQDVPHSLHQGATAGSRPKGSLPPTATNRTRSSAIIKATVNGRIPTSAHTTRTTTVSGMPTASVPRWARAAITRPETPKARRPVSNTTRQPASETPRPTRPRRHWPPVQRPIHQHTSSARESLRLQSQFAVRTKTDEFEDIGAALAVDEYEIGPEVTVAAALPSSRQGVVAVPGIASSVHTSNQSETS